MIHITDTCAVTSNLKAVRVCSSHHLQGAGAYCGGHATRRAACCMLRKSLTKARNFRLFAVHKGKLTFKSRNILSEEKKTSVMGPPTVTLLHPQAQSSLKITNRSFRYAAPHRWNKLPPSLCVPCQSATSECVPPLPGSDSAPKSVVGVSHWVFHSRLKLTFSPDPFPVTFLSL